jgi:hypothetical protein
MSKNTVSRMSREFSAGAICNLFEDTIVILDTNLFDDIPAKQNFNITYMDDDGDKDMCSFGHLKTFGKYVRHIKDKP